MTRFQVYERDRYYRVLAVRGHWWLFVEQAYRGRAGSFLLLVAYDGFPEASLTPVNADLVRVAVVNQYLRAHSELWDVLPESLQVELEEVVTSDEESAGDE
ncbi:hypothetical protein J8273_8185 [Carpediemonas membranifera]|uniref:Uncharacterized protein n=1 Tax=Carpediemonas membranifera TaxID=201153 RepID=A0A8J6DZA0_9EUKA|nr:hypothetical protein J8273_8185 [Carpediemonas membranifera]|eukprot:KAG9390146.1 hypothetical protein J8273_8185 [Carpediemonas membranifera]